MTSKRAGELVAENMKTLYLWSLSKISDPSEAEELCSQIMLEIIESAPRLKCDEAFFGFIWKVAANTYKHYLRKKHREFIYEPDETIPDESDDIEYLIEKLGNDAQVTKLRRELAFLSRKYRLCTVAYYFEGISVKEIAERYNFSQESVKFCLFKSRKILKEGIAMERQFGEKSFKPQQFDFQTIINGNDNTEFNNLFKRLIPGQILLTTYYEPMTTSQISVELGIATVYIEDEIRTLEEYGLLKKIGENKYVTNMLILTEEFITDIVNKLNKAYSSDIKHIIDSIRAKLPEIRAKGIGEGFSDNLLLWDLFAMFEIIALKSAGGEFKTRKLYDKTSGVCYGISGSLEDISDYLYTCFAGSTTFDSDRDGTFIGYKVCDKNGTDTTTIYNEVKNNPSLCPILTETQADDLIDILKDVYSELLEVTKQISVMSEEVLREHSPKNVQEMIDYYCPHLSLWQLAGWYGGAAVNTGALEIPKQGEYAGVVAFKK